jgi:hypothetical protein
VKLEWNAINFFLSLSPTSTIAKLVKTLVQFMLVVVLTKKKFCIILPYVTHVNNFANNAPQLALFLSQ